MHRSTIKQPEARLVVGLLHFSEAHMPYNFPRELQREINAFANDDAGQVDQEVQIVRWLIQKSGHGW